MDWLGCCASVNIEVLNKELEPVRMHIGDAGLDCRSAELETVVVNPGSAELVNLGFKIEIPYGYAGFLMSRSGHSKVQVSLANAVGLIDHTYRGLVMARVENRGVGDFEVNYLDRIAQLVIVPVALPRVIIVDKVADTARGEAGFGSTGVK